VPLELLSVALELWYNAKSCPQTYTAAHCRLQERELEVVTLKAQLSEFRQPALAVAGGTTWDSDTAEAAEPLRGSSSYSNASWANASWANNWSTGVIQSADIGTAVLETQPQALSVLQSQLSAATVRCEAPAEYV